MGASTLAKSAFKGDELYQRRGRAALPLLVRQAIAAQPVTYGELADELGMPNPRNLNFVLGSVARALVDLSEEWGEVIPRLTTLVVDKTTKLPSEGIVEFFDDADAYLRASTDQRRLIVDRLLFDVYMYPRWNAVLNRWKVSPLPPADQNGATPRWGGPESEAHLELKAFVAHNPSLLGLPRKTRGRLEECLPSGDEIDVYFSVRRREVGVEVKTSAAPESEVARGLYQCVKYQALLLARSKATETRTDIRVLLALGGKFPPPLLPLRNVLGVEVIDGIEAMYAPAATGGAQHPVYGLLPPG